MQERTYATTSPRSFACDLATLCAPTLAGLKPASLFRYQPAPGQDAAAMAAAWHTELSPRGVTVQVLKQCPRTGAVLVYVYRPARVAKLLADDRTLAFLAGEGYTPGTADELLAQLAAPPVYGWIGNVVKNQTLASAVPKAAQAVSASPSGEPLAMTGSTTMRAPAASASSAQVRIHSPSPQP